MIFDRNNDFHKIFLKPDYKLMYKYLNSYSYQYLLRQYEFCDHGKGTGLKLAENHGTPKA